LLGEKDLEKEYFRETSMESQIARVEPLYKHSETKRHTRPAIYDDCHSCAELSTLVSGLSSDSGEGENLLRLMT
jgi:hypothetical protein